MKVQGMGNRTALWAARLLKRHMYYHLHPELYEDYSDLFLRKESD